MKADIFKFKNMTDNPSFTVTSLLEAILCRAFLVKILSGKSYSYLLDISLITLKYGEKYKGILGNLFIFWLSLLRPLIDDERRVQRIKKHKEVLKLFKRFFL